MLDVLTKPTPGWIALWAGLAFLWFVFLPQHLTAADDLSKTSIPGSSFWLAVLVVLLLALRRTWLRWRELQE